MATRYDCKFIETSVIINYNVDELLVGILTQIRLKLDQPPEYGATRSFSMRKRSKSPLANCGPTFKKYRGSRTSASLRVKGLLSKVWARDSKSKSCENLHVLWWNGFGDNTENPVRNRFYEPSRIVKHAVFPPFGWQPYVNFWQHCYDHIIMY